MLKNEELLDLEDYVPFDYTIKPKQMLETYDKISSLYYNNLGLLYHVKNDYEYDIKEYIEFLENKIQEWSLEYNNPMKSKQDIIDIYKSLEDKLSLKDLKEFRSIIENTDFTKIK